MRTILLTLLSGVAISSFAGTIENRKSGETLEFFLDRQNQTIEILSSSPKVANGTIALKTVNAKNSQINIYGITEATCETLFWRFNGTLASCLLIPVFNLPGIVVGTIETLMLPFKASTKLIQNMKMKKDFNVLMQAINSTEIKTVSDKRFDRIEQLLSN